MSYRNTSIVLLSAFLVLAACVGSPQTRYYTLASPTTNGGSSKAATAYSVAVGPVTVPEIVDRPHLVVRTNPNQVVVLEEHRWAEPLKNEILRVITENLTRELDNAWVTEVRQAASHNSDFRVSIDVQRFDSVQGEGVTIEALWVIRRNSGGPSRMGRSVADEAVNGNGYDALVAVHGRALASISHEIAEAIRTFDSSAR